MGYTFEIYIYTDGDLYLPFIPRDMKYDGGYTYSLDKDYDNREIAIRDVLDIINFLDRNLETSKNHVRKTWNECLCYFRTRLMEDVINCNKVIHISSEKYGNVELSFKLNSVERKLKLEFSVTDEEYEMIVNSSNKINKEMLKETFIDLYKKVGTHD